MSRAAPVAGTTSQLPLFPLNAVLFPGGPLSLRIFETRYVDMVRRCMRDQSGFGVVLIRSGAEAGEVARSAAIGTLANIVDFNQLPDGLLGITALGSHRFRVLRRWRADDGLNVADVEWLAEAVEVAPTEIHEHLGQLLRKFLPELDEVYRFVQADFGSAAWISARLAELLPVSLEDKQAWLEMDDPLERLNAVAPFIRRPPH